MKKDKTLNSQSHKSQKIEQLNKIIIRNLLLTSVYILREVTIFYNLILVTNTKINKRDK